MVMNNENPLQMLENKIFYKYKSKANRDLNSDGKEEATYSMIDILNMNQNEIGQTVFMFDNKQGDLFESKKQFNELQ